jgi:hypothetical protein
VTLFVFIPHCIVMQVMFICNHCPFVIHLKKDIVKLTKFYMKVAKQIAGTEIYLFISSVVGLDHYKNLFFPLSTERTCCRCYIFKFCSYSSPGDSKIITSLNIAASKLLNDLSNLEFCVTGRTRVYGRRC